MTKEVTSPIKIKETVVTYCKEQLTNRQPREGFEEDLELKRELHNVRMNETINN